MQAPGPTAQRSRVVLDSSALLSRWPPELITTAALGYYQGYWSSWIVGEVVRKRTEWIAQRAIREAVDPAGLRRRLLESRRRVNALVRRLSDVLLSVDYATAEAVDLSWLADPDDWPVMQTAIVALAPLIVTENSRDFPPGESRSGVTFARSADFLTALYRATSTGETDVHNLRRGS